MPLHDQLYHLIDTDSLKEPLVVILSKNLEIGHSRQTSSFYDQQGHPMFVVSVGVVRRDRVL